MTHFTHYPSVPPTLAEAVVCLLNRIMSYTMRNISDVACGLYSRPDLTPFSFVKRSRSPGKVSGKYQFDCRPAVLTLPAASVPDGHPSPPGYEGSSPPKHFGLRNCDGFLDLK